MNFIELLERIPDLILTFLGKISQIIVYLSGIIAFCQNVIAKNSRINYFWCKILNNFFDATVFIRYWTEDLLEVSYITANKTDLIYMAAEIYIVNKDGTFVKLKSNRLKYKKVENGRAVWGVMIPKGIKNWDEVEVKIIWERKLNSFIKRFEEKKYKPQKSEVGFNIEWLLEDIEGYTEPTKEILKEAKEIAGPVCQSLYNIREEIKNSAQKIAEEIHSEKDKNDSFSQ